MNQDLELFWVIWGIFTAMSLISSVPLTRARRRAITVHRQHDSQDT